MFRRDPRKELELAPGRGFEPRTTGLTAHRTMDITDIVPGNDTILPGQMPHIAQPSIEMYSNRTHFSINISIPISDKLIDEFVFWCTKVKQRKITNETAKYYASLVKKYIHVLSMPKYERKKVFSEITPKKRSWIKDALSVYAKFLDDLYGFDEPFFYDVVHKKLRDVKRYRYQGRPNAPETEEVVKLVKAAR